MTPAALLAICAPLVSPVTMSAVVQHESGGSPFAIHDNTDSRTYAPSSIDAAVSTAKRLIASGHSVDLGLAQINSKNLRWLHLTVEQSFDACQNLRASQQVLIDAHDRAGGDLKQTLQIYNSGKAAGSQYSSAVYGKAGVVVPAIPGGRMADWTNRPVAGGAILKDMLSTSSSVPLVAKVSWTPAASPFSPDGNGLSASGF